MPNWEDVVEVALRFPEVETYTAFKTPALRVNEKFMARLRTGPDALVLRVVDLGEREALLQGDPAVFFSTPHYDGHPYVLIRLPEVDPVELTELVEDAWRTQAPKRAIKAYDGEGN